MDVLVFNCGSSSIKYKLYAMPEGTAIATGSVQRIGEERSEAFQKAGTKETRISKKIVDHAQGLEEIRAMLTNKNTGAIASLSDIGACGHRVVHGGEQCTGSIIIDAAVEKAIERYADLAPLHNPPNLAGIRAAEKMFGAIPQVACFDTAFHATIPEVAFMYALPYKLYEEYRIRRYGFHGISHRYLARRAAAILNKGKYDVDCITCHLGNGCSITAVKNGRSVDTSMGLTPLEGLVMGSRSGDIDPAIIFYLVKKGYKPEELDTLLNKKAGLVGVSELSNDVRNLEASAAAGSVRAKLALDIFAYRIRKYIGAYLAVLNRCDAIVLSGGIGENGAAMRSRILSELDFLGIRLDAEKNNRMVGKEGEISARDSRIKVFVVPTDEESAIARDTYDIVVNGQVGK